MGREYGSKVGSDTEAIAPMPSGGKARASARRTIAHVSHELRTPLIGISGLTELLLDTTLTAEQRNYVRLLRASSEAMLGMVDALLNPDATQARPAAAIAFDPAALVVETVELISLKAQSRGLELATCIGPDIPARVIGDPAALRRILTNLLGNAVKYTTQGGASIALTQSVDGRLRFEVADTGPGITAHERRRIFRERVRGAASGASRAPGQGLGLAIVAKLVRELGGTLELASSPAGSTFTLTLMPNGGASGTSPDPCLNGEGVLVLSPSPVLREALSRQLVLWGAEVEAVARAADLAPHLSRRRWKAVLVDAALDEQEIAAAVRASRPHAARRIALIPPNERAALQTLRAIGFETYLVKPVRPDSLASRIMNPVSAAPDPAERAIEAEPAPRARLPASRRRHAILIAEDDDVGALLLGAMLARMGHAPTRVADGTAAVAAVRDAAAAGKPFDLVLMDMNLPSCDGLAATGLIRALATGSAIPILGMSASLDTALQAAAAKAGLPALLAKPIDPAQLAQALGRVLAKRRAA